MLRTKIFLLVLFIGTGLMLLVPAAASAQSGVAGVVRDQSGAALPGVTVEASSPALIEKVRTAVTDEQGQFKITELRSGLYTVTFSLPGFATVKREGIELTSNFTATINAELPIGSVEETLTVSGESPIVDVQNVNARHVVTTEVMDALPTAKSIQNLAVLIPGLNVQGGMRIVAQDVGGLAGDRTFMTIHGSKDVDQTMQMDGMTFNTMQSSGASPGYTPNPGEVSEYAYDIGNNSAESAKGGVRVNMIPKDGGNVYRGSVFFSWSNENFVGDNVTDDLRARGLASGSSPQKLHDFTGAFGGPIKQDKLWFNFSFRHWGFTDYVANMWKDVDPLDFVYTPDLSKPATNENRTTSTGLRLTWQATPKNKFAGHFINQTRCLCQQGVANTRTLEASAAQISPILFIGSAVWSAPVNNRLLLEAGWIRNRHHFGADFSPRDDVGPKDPLATFGAQERNTGVFFRAPGTMGFTNNMVDSYKAVASYVTGSHAIKFGNTWRWGYRNQPNRTTGPIPVLLRMLNGRPDSVIVYTTPYTNAQHLNYDGGLFAQDQWTLKRMTVYGGIRWDYLNAQADEVHEPAAYFVGARDFAAVKDVPRWHDVSPRMGIAYDLFGNGKTALKASLNRYVAGQAVDLATANSGIQTSVNSTTRTWTDANNDFYPDESELGPLGNTNFGKVVISTRYDDDMLKGFGKRGYNWEASGGIQHELMPQVAVQGMYFRRSFSNQTVTDNTLVTPDDFDPYCVNVPVDPRLPDDVSGAQICGFYDIKANKFGANQGLVTFAKNYGEQTEVYDGVDFSINARLPHGVFVQGGTSTGHITSSSCFVVDSPQQLHDCDVKPPYRTEVKIAGSVQLPWAFQLSGTFQSIPGPSVTASYVVRTADVISTLGRPLSGGANATATVELIKPGTLFDDRLNQIDLRVSRSLSFGGARLKLLLDMYNVLNANPVLAENLTYGRDWRNPSYILPPHMLKFGVQTDW